MCIEFCFYILHCLPYFIQLFIYILFEFIHVFIHILSNFVEPSYNYSFNLFVWDSNYLAIIIICYCGIIEFWRSHIAFLNFHMFFQ
jgi:hypothetical protein